MAGVGEFSIHPAEIEAQAPTFASESEALSKALGTLKTALAGLGAPWGSDSQGAQFAAGYQPQHDALLKMLGTLVTGLQSISEGLSAHAANHVEADAHTAASLKR